MSTDRGRLIWESVMYEPPYDACVFCSSYTTGPVPAVYEAWFELRNELLEFWAEGRKVRPDDAPHCVRQAYCAKCAYEVRLEEDQSIADGMPMLMIRTLK